MMLACTFPATALAQPRALRAAFDAWWDAEAVDTLASPPTVVRLVRRSPQDLHEVALRCALDPIAHVALRRAARRAAGVCLIYEQETTAATDEEVAVELSGGRP